MKYIKNIRFIIEEFCIEHPLVVAFSVGFILGGLIFS
jgi:mannose/fructose/N-acetylgalactosamine-specific phosphotransferase system component IIC